MLNEGDHWNFTWSYSKSQEIIFNSPTEMYSIEKSKQTNNQTPPQSY